MKKNELYYSACFVWFDITRIGCSHNCTQTEQNITRVLVCYNIVAHKEKCIYYLHTYTHHTHTQTHTHIHTHKHTHTQTHAYTHSNIHIYIQTQVHTCVRSLHYIT